MSEKIKWISILLIAIGQFLTAAEFSMNQLKLVADGLNIEGGTIPKHYLRRNQIWANLCLILDRPFEDNVEWQQLTNSNVFPLKEASILNYNEAQVNFAYATVMHYYITHSHLITNKPDKQLVKMVVQVHRNTSGPLQLELLEQLLLQCFPELEGVKQFSPSSSPCPELFAYLFPQMNLKVAFCYGSTPENLEKLRKKYDGADIVLSFSLEAGLHASWKSGSLLIPDQYVPFSLKNLVFAPQAQYLVRNHLKEVVSDMINQQDERILKIVNEKFKSLNSLKSNLDAKKLAPEYYKEAVLLQVDNKFNSSQLP